MRVAFPSPLRGFEVDLAIEPAARSSAEKAGEIAQQSGSPAIRHEESGGGVVPAARNAGLAAGHFLEDPTRPLRGHPPLEGEGTRFLAAALILRRERSEPRRTHAALRAANFLSASAVTRP